MNTPIYDFLKEYEKGDFVRAHMPGHKGCASLLGVEGIDLTEIDGADELYEANGIIRESETNASRLFGAHTFYSAEGSSLSIRAMIFLAVKYAKIHGKNPKILAGRNAHKTFVNTLAILDLPVDWMYGSADDSFESCTISPEDLEEKLASYDKEDLPSIFYATSPDYLGQMADIAGLSAICHKYGMIFCLDNAHGAYLKFLEPSLHPMDLGADLCADSAHKTLPVLTGGAYLHISKEADSFFYKNAKEALQLFGSTSPSYLILASLDLANAYLENFKEGLQDFLPKINDLKEGLQKNGWILTGDEALKITICPLSYGYRGEELAGFLKKEGIFVEYYDASHLVLMLTPQNSNEDLMRIKDAFEKIPRKAALDESIFSIKRNGEPRQRISMRDALFSETEEVVGEAARGRVLASAAISCPPAVPLYMYGEEVAEPVEGKIYRLAKKQ